MKNAIELNRIASGTPSRELTQAEAREIYDQMIIRASSEDLAAVARVFAFKQSSRGVNYERSYKDYLSYLEGEKKCAGVRQGSLIVV